MAPGIFRRGAESSDKGAKILFLGCFHCQESPNNSFFHLLTGGLSCFDGGLQPSPGTTPGLKLKLRPTRRLVCSCDLVMAFPLKYIRYVRAISLIESYDCEREV